MFFDLYATALTGIKGETMTSDAERRAKGTPQTADIQMASGCGKHGWRYLSLTIARSCIHGSTQERQMPIHHRTATFLRRRRRKASLAENDFITAHLPHPHA